MTSDENIHGKISELVAREKELRERLQDGDIEQGEEHSQLHDIEVQLDQCWDLLRQRQALREAGADPAKAEVRPPGEVENYLQ
jgi:hypothetical protein